jgi:hypothetical protein
MKNALTILLLTSLLIAACEPTASQLEQTPTEVAETYTWAKYGLSFEIPEGLVVSDHNFVDALLLDEKDLSNFEGDYLGQITIRPETESSIEAVIEKYSTEQDFAQEVVSKNGKTYTYLSYYSQFADYDAELYLVESNGVVYSVAKTWTGTQEDLDLILETLSF